MEILEVVARPSPLSLSAALLLEPVNDLLREPDRLGDPEAGAGEDPVHGLPHPNPVPRRDEERPHANAGSEDCANLLPFQAERAPVASLRARVLVLAYQQ